MKDMAEMLEKMVTVEFDDCDMEFAEPNSCHGTSNYVCCGNDG